MDFYRKSVGVVCCSALGLVPVCSADASANNNFMKPSDATVYKDEREGENLGLKICCFMKKFCLTLLFLDVTLFFLYFLYNIILVLWRKAVDFFSVIKFKYFYNFCFRTSNRRLVFNLRTKKGKKISSLDDIASKGKDKVRVKSENKKDEKDRDEDFVEFNLENLSMEEEDIDTVGNEYTSEDLSPYGWKKDRYTKEEEKEKIQQIHNWVEGKDLLDKVTIGDICDNGFEKNFEYFRRGYDPKKGCCYVWEDSEEIKNFYRSENIDKSSCILN